MRNLVIILDPAHGSDVAGKSSPDGTHKEYIWSRNICNSLAKQLEDLDFRVEFTNTSELEIGLSKRKQIANNIKIEPNQSKLLLALHNNAAGMGNNWCNASGYEVFTSWGNTNTKSRVFGKILVDNLKSSFPTYKYRGLKESNFTVLMGDYYALYIEWLFQDNKENVRLLKNDLVNDRLVVTLVKAIVEMDNINNQS